MITKLITALFSCHEDRVSVMKPPRFRTTKVKTPRSTRHPKTIPLGAVAAFANRLGLCYAPPAH